VNSEKFATAVPNPDVRINKSINNYQKKKDEWKEVWKPLDL
jgi:hypothetical protein